MRMEDVVKNLKDVVVKYVVVLHIYFHVIGYIYVVVRGMKKEDVAKKSKDVAERSVAVLHIYSHVIGYIYAVAKAMVKRKIIRVNPQKTQTKDHASANVSCALFHVAGHAYFVVVEKRKINGN